MNYNLLPMFGAVAETRSMSAAARQLGVPKSSVSRAIVALETSLQAELFHRTTRAVELTSAGRAFFDRVRPLVASLRELSGTLPERGDVLTGQLRITSPRDMAMTWFSEALVEFSARHPALQLDVVPTERTVDLVRERFDLALRVAGKLRDSALVARRLGGIATGVYASPGYVARRGTVRTFAELAEHDWVIQPKYAQLSKLPTPRSARISTDDMTFACVAIKRGLGVGFLPTFLGQPCVVAGELVRVLPSWSADAATLFLVHPYHQHVPRRVTAFRDFIVAYLGVHPLRA